MHRALTLLLAVILGCSSSAFAVSSGKSIDFTGSPMGAVHFDGTIHKQAVASCKDCHNEGMFPKMKQGTVKITMADIYAGKLCGVCHNGQKAFEAKANCGRCHVKK